MSKIYAGIGSRKTPTDTLILMENFAIRLAERGYTLRSGGAKGADKTFERGCDIAVKESCICHPEGGGTVISKEIFYADDATAEAMTHASYHHPAWLKCSEYARKLHGRNSMIVLGKDLDAPVDFIVCWTPGGKLEGGTAQALRIAADQNIKIYNLFKEADVQDLIIFIAEL